MGGTQPPASPLQFEYWLDLICRERVEQHYTVGILPYIANISFACSSNVDYGSQRDKLHKSETKRENQKFKSNVSFGPMSPNFNPAMSRNKA